VGSRPEARRAPLRPGRIGLLAVVVLFALTLVTARSCQQSQVRVSQERAVATAQERAGFTPERSQVRLVRQGLRGRPYWAVSLSVPATGRVAVVRVDANTGAVASVDRDP
jgi:uncharacterized membrane protein YkoI